MQLNWHHQHPWDVSPDEAIQIQQDLRARVAVQPLLVDTIRLVGGVDASFTRQRIFAAVVVLEYGSNELVEQIVFDQPLTFPYIPGLLSFREAPAILAAMERLSRLPDVLLVDGHGWAHPRRFGLACHLGVLLDLPTIGCAKSILVGVARSVSEDVGSTSDLLDGEEVIGWVLRTRRRVKPVYVSIGHKVDLPSAALVVLACGGGYRLPEPTRLADRLAGWKKQELP